MKDSQILAKLTSQIVEGTAFQRSSALDRLRDLGKEDAFRDSDIDPALIETIVNFLDSEEVSLEIKAAQSLAGLARSETARKLIGDAGANSKLLKLLQPDGDGGTPSSELSTALLQTVEAMAVDEGFRLAFRGAGGLAVIIGILGRSEDQEEMKVACNVLSSLGANEAGRNAVRQQNGPKQLLRILKMQDVKPALATAVLEAITVLAIESEANQEHFRQQNSLSLIIHFLDIRISKDTAAAAVDCLTALCINNQDTKDEIRDLWAIPLLVGLLNEPKSDLAEKTVDCLRILTTANERNKLALFSIPAGVKSLINIMTVNSPSAAITERAAAVIGNLSSTTQFFPAIRECGGLQRLVALVDAGPDAKVTEIAAKSLANMADNENNRKGIELAGGRPALINLLTQGPSAEVILAVEEALRRMKVTDNERKVTLETLHYCQHLYEDRKERGSEAGLEEPAAVTNGLNELAQPLTQYTVEDACWLLQSLGVQNIDAFRRNGVTGGDLLELTPEELLEDLELPPLQVKKIRNLVDAFNTFESISSSPGKGELTLMELQDWMQDQGRDEEEIQSVIHGFKRALGRELLPSIAFGDFARQFQWFTKTLKVMALARDDSLDVSRLPSLASVGTSSHNLE